MTKLFIDVNIFVYAFSPQSEFHKKSVQILEKLVTEGREGIITPFVLNELHYFFWKKRSKDEAQEIIEKILLIPRVSLVNYIFDKGSIRDLMSLSREFGLKPFDAYHAFYCKMLDVTYIATFDKHFKKIPWLKTIVTL